MTDDGIAQMIRKRGAEAGIKGLHPHTRARRRRRAKADEGGTAK
jgi:hypothetical protein